MGVCRDMKRVVNEEILVFTDKYYQQKDKPLHIIYEAPTGYGKTSLAPQLASIVEEAGLSTSYIHILPMRSMVRKIYEEVATKINKTTCYQAGGLFLAGKNPFLACNANIVTFDSYMLNLIRVGVEEVARHYESARTMIFTSTIIYDEAHLYGGDPGNPEESLYTSFLVSLETVALANSPVIVMTATLPKTLAYRIYEELTRISRINGSTVLWIRYGKAIKSDNINSGIKYIDREYDNLVNNVKWYTEITRDPGLNNICNTIIEEASTGKKILVIMNKPVRAVKIYECLSQKGLKPLLIHGRMKYGEREELEKRINESNILVATQVVEAGINVDYDVLYTDIAPISNLIQRAGRVNRWFNKPEGKVVIIYDKESYDNIYPDNIVVTTLNTIKKRVDKRKNSINWRSPYTCYELIEEVYQKQAIQPIYSSIIDLEVLARTSYADRKTVYRTIASYCYRLENPIRGSLLIPLIHLTDDMDKYELYRVYENTIPASFSWIITNRKQLFPDKIKALILKYDKESGETIITEEPIGSTVDDLKNKVCRYISWPKRELFLGLIVKAEAYVEKRGLLV